MGGYPIEPLSLWSCMDWGKTGPRWAPSVAAVIWSLLSIKGFPMTTPFQSLGRAKKFPSIPHFILLPRLFPFLFSFNRSPSHLQTHLVPGEFLNPLP